MPRAAEDGAGVRGKGGSAVTAQLSLLDAPGRLSGATLSPCGTYRYHLWRARNDGHGRIVWIMLNPSTADADHDDATMRKVMGYSWRWGYQRLEVVNLYALRSTDPAVLKTHADPVGPENNAWIFRTARAADKVVVAFGKLGGLRRDDICDELLGISDDAAEELRLWCLGENSDGSPKHPLYLPNDAELEPWCNPYPEPRR
jgi:hypothetical protein